MGVSRSRQPLVGGGILWCVHMGDSLCACVLLWSKSCYVPQRTERLTASAGAPTPPPGAFFHLTGFSRCLCYFIGQRGSLFVAKRIFKRLYLNTNQNNPLCNMQSKAQCPSCLQHIVFDMQFLIVNQPFAAHPDL